jgi:hypothetical protein
MWTLVIHTHEIISAIFGGPGHLSIKYIIHSLLCIAQVHQLLHLLVFINVLFRFVLLYCHPCPGAYNSLLCIITFASWHFYAPIGSYAAGSTGGNKGGDVPTPGPGGAGGQGPHEQIADEAKLWEHRAQQWEQWDQYQADMNLDPAGAQPQSPQQWGCTADEAKMWEHRDQLQQWDQYSDHRSAPYDTPAPAGYDASGPGQAGNTKPVFGQPWGSLHLLK